MASSAPEVIAAAQRFRRIVTAICVTPGCSIVGYVAWVKWRLHKSTHRAYTPNDMYYIRTMDGSTPTLIDNPGIRVESDFLSEDEQEQLRFDSKMMISHYGYSTIPFWARPNWNKQISSLLSKTRVNAVKVTGRDPSKLIPEPPMTEHSRELRSEQEAALVKSKPYETNPPTQAPWKWAQQFDINPLPQSFKQLIQKIKQLPDYKLGGVRDVAVDFRDDRYFRIDPHIYPGLDGANVFMVTLESDGVITLVPDRRDVYWRSAQTEINELSWSDKDLDILHQRGDLLCFSDKARTDLSWGSRLGVDENIKQLKQVLKRKYKYDDDDTDNVSEYKRIVGNENILRKTDENKDEYVLCDWWGTRNQIIPRNKEKIIITISFARPT